VTAEEIVVAALARCAEFGDQWPSARSVMYQRINTRHRQLFAMMTTALPDLAGVVENAPVVSGVVDLTALEYDVASVVDVRIPADGVYALDQRVAIIPVDDPDAGLPPRMTASLGELRAYGNELDGVPEVRVAYTRLAESIEMEDDEPELPELFHPLLVLDLARYNVQKAISIPSATRAEIAALFDVEEKAMLADFESYLFAYSPVQRRFAGPSTGDSTT
jgi:hypothetical protein